MGIGGLCFCPKIFNLCLTTDGRVKTFTFTLRMPSMNSSLGQYPSPSSSNFLKKSCTRDFLLLWNFRYLDISKIGQWNKRDSIIFRKWCTAGLITCFHTYYWRNKKFFKFINVGFKTIAGLTSFSNPPSRSSWRSPTPGGSSACLWVSYYTKK